MTRGKKTRTTTTMMTIGMAMAMVTESVGAGAVVTTEGPWQLLGLGLPQ